MNPLKGGPVVGRILVALGSTLLLLSACSDEGGQFEVELSAENEVCEGDTCGGEGSGTARWT